MLLTRSLLLLKSNPPPRCGQKSFAVRPSHVGLDQDADRPHGVVTMYGFFALMSQNVQSIFHQEMRFSIACAVMLLN